MTKEELIRELDKLAWDGPYTGKDLYELLMHNTEELNGLTKTWLYIKILNGFRWYKVLDIVPSNQLPALLNDQVIQGLFPRPLRNKYRNVRSILFS